jgi:hypothetical protein
MKRLAMIVVILALAGCSSKAKPSANGTPSTSGSASPRATASTPRSSRPQPEGSGTSAAPGAAASTRSTSKTTVGSAVVPAPGTYHYSQSGGVQAGPFSFNADPKGTLAIGAPVTDGDAKREQQERVYSSSWSQQQVLLFRSSGVFLKSIISRFGSGAFVQEDTCTPSHPVKAIALPFVVGNSWSDQATCSGRNVTIRGKVLRTETRTIGGARVPTDVVNIVTHQSGGGYDITVNLTMWIAPAYGLSVHATQSGSGSAQGSPFSENLTEDLDRLTPDP